MSLTREGRSHLILDEFFLPIDNPVETFWISNRNIPCLEPLILCDRIGSRTRVVQVSLYKIVSARVHIRVNPTKTYLHDRWPPDPQLPSIAFLRVFTVIENKPGFKVG